ncbi:MAG: dihydrodipicolinate synthase family protein [Alphaproteobacteria bacterium]|nr:dihydrodipicolinate synthase family protein [Alphaproteobacteria bacterium]
MFDFTKGIYAACVTPFWSNGSIDWPSLRAYFAEVVAGSPDGLVVNTVLGEAAALSLTEAVDIVARARDAARGVCAVVTGIDTRWGTIGETVQDLSEAGAEGFLISAGGTRASIAGADDLLAVDQLSSLAMSENLTTDEVSFLDDRKRGCLGAVLGFAGLPTSKMVALNRFLDRGDMQQAERLWGEIEPWAKFCATGDAGRFVTIAKQILYRQRVIASATTRAPIAPPNRDLLEAIDGFFVRHRLDKPENLPPGFILARTAMPR